MIKRLLEKALTPPAGPVKKASALSIWNPLGWVFFAAFSLPGIAITVGLAISNSLIMQKQLWVETPARLHTHLENPAEIDEPDDLYYTYRYEGEFYREEGLGTRSFFIESDDLDKLARNLGREIPREERTSVWVNPRDPSRSSLVQEKVGYVPFFLSIFTLSHGATGLALFFASLNHSRRTRGMDSRIAATPDRPLEWRDDWKRGESRFEGGYTLFIMAYATVAIAIALWWSTLNAWLTRSPAGVILTGTLASVVGMGFAWHFFRTLNRVRLSRTTRVTFTRGTPRSGASNLVTLRGFGSMPYRVQNADDWKLTCEDGVNDSENRATSKYTFEGEVAATGIGELTLRFDLPDYAPATSAPNDQYTGYTWKLSGGGLGPFEIPVLPDPDGGSFEPVAASEIELPRTVEAINHSLSSEQIAYIEGNGDRLIHIPANRHPGGAWFCILFGIVFGGMGLIVGVAAWQAIIPAIGGAVFLAFGGFITWTGVCMKWQNAVVGRFEADGVIRMERTLGSIKSTADYRLDRVEKISLEEDHQRNNRQTYKVVLFEKTDRGTKGHSLVNWIENEAAGEILARLLQGDDRNGPTRTRA